MAGVDAISGGALAGLAAGLALSLYVAVLDARKRSAGLRSRAHYRGSLVVVPALLAGFGALVGAAFGHVV